MSFAIAKTALMAANALITTTTHNIANVGREDYTRQKTYLEANEPNLIGGNLIGSGVRIGSTRRITDNAMLNVHRENMTSESYAATQQLLIGDVNGLLANDETSLNQRLTSLFNAINRLATESPGPSQNTVLLGAVRDELDNFVQSANNLGARLKTTRDTVMNELTESVDRVHALGLDIRELNQKILVAQNMTTASEPNDLKDKRDAALKELSKYVAVKTVELKDGTIDVHIGTGQPLVVGGRVTNFSTRTDPSDNSRREVVIITDNLTEFKVDANITGGKIGALLDFESDLLRNAEGDLNKVVMSVAMTFNEQHKLGMDSNGALGENLFTDFNELSYQLARVLPSANNLGTAKFSVSINDIPRISQPPYIATSSATALTATGTLTTHALNDLVINGVAIRATTATDDTVSPAADNEASAIALARAINDTLVAYDITAKANHTLVNLGTFTNGTMALANEFVINGVSINSTGASAKILVTDVNSQSHLTGVRAELSEANEILLIAEDGRNIQLTANGNATGTFSNLDITSAQSMVARASISITANSSDLVISGNDLASVNLQASTTPVTVSSLTESDYEMYYNGSDYTLTRLSDAVVVGRSLTSNFNVDGFTISYTTGLIQQGDTYIIRPTTSAARALQLETDNIRKFAFTSPIKVRGHKDNISDAKIIKTAIVSTDGPAGGINTYGNSFATAGKLSPPIKIVILNDSQNKPTRYKIFDMTNAGNGVQIGPEYPFTPGADIFPLHGLQDQNNAPYTWDPGYRIKIEGTVAANDTFFVEMNDGKGDYANAAEFIKMQHEALLDNQNLTYQSSYAQLVSTIGMSLNNATNAYDSAKILSETSNKRISDYSGVNMDEEGANLIQYYQFYSAASQILSVQSNMFNSLMMAVRS